MDDSTAHAFGRIEAKIDGVAAQVGNLAVAVAEHGIRLNHVEDRVAELKNEDHRQISVRDKITVGLITVLASGGMSWIIAALVR